MAYTKTNWVNDSVPAINASNLNKIEQGIYDNAFESGSNANGNYIKFNDGTLICRGGITTASNESEKEIYFPVSFINDSFTVIVTNIYSNSKKVIWSIANFNKEYFKVFPMAYDTNAVPTSASSANYIAIGRWK
jgi:hypothetical protein